MDGLTEKERSGTALKQVFDFYDAKSDGKIDFEEFLDPEGVRVSVGKGHP